VTEGGEYTQEVLNVCGCFEFLARIRTICFKLVKEPLNKSNRRMEKITQ
jgi:hypothetical protein